MPVRHLEQFSFGGQDSWSNAANFPFNRAIRCRNFKPDANGSLPLRNGYTVAMQSTNDTVGASSVSQLHSLVYYEQFGSGYLGAQYVLYGKGSNLLSLNLSSGAASVIGTGIGGNSTPWGHFRARNSIFMADGTSMKQWDGASLRPVGIRAPQNSDWGGSTAVDNTSYATSFATIHGLGETVWTNPGNATGAPDGVYATVIKGVTSFDSDDIDLTGFNFNITSTYSIQGITATVRYKVEDGVWNVFLCLLRSGAAVGAIKTLTVSSTTAADEIAGAINDLWSDSGWTPTNVNDSSFGIRVSVRHVSGGGSFTFSLDSIGLSVRSVLAATPPAGSFSANANGSWSVTVLTGYQPYFVYYNPQTGHAGNRIKLGSRLTNLTNTTVSLSLTNLPDLSSINPEWVKGIGVTLDGGEVPYWLVDSNNDRIVVANAATTAAILLGNIDAELELPTRNDVPPGLDKFAKVGTRIFGHKAGNQDINYSNDQADVSNADYVGNPEESWPADQAEPLPTGELPTAIHAYGLEGWFLSREHLCIWSNFLLLQGANPWRGPWPGGCVGQRAFIVTPHGPFWITPQKQLVTFGDNEVVSASTEYEAALLGRLKSSLLGQVELGYLLDQEQGIDQIEIVGLDENSNRVVTVHDFMLKDSRSPYGQGYEKVYSGVSPRTFAGSGFTPRQNVYDTSGNMRLWAGSSQLGNGTTQEGFIAQLEDGLSDNGSTISGDYIALLSMGPKRPGLVEVEYQGDQNVSFSYLKKYDLTVNDMETVDKKTVPGESSRFTFPLSGETRWMYARFQLDSHAGDAPADSDPLNLPIPTYGIINMVDVKLGPNREQGS